MWVLEGKGWTAFVFSLPHSHYSWHISLNFFLLFLLSVFLLLVFASCLPGWKSVPGVSRRQFRLSLNDWRSESRFPESEKRNSLCSPVLSLSLWLSPFFCLSFLVVIYFLLFPFFMFIVVLFPIYQFVNMYYLFNIHEIHSFEKNQTFFLYMTYSIQELLFLY